MLCLRSPPLQAGSDSGFYPPTPIPLSVCSENYLLDTFNDILLGTLSTTQDFLPTLIALHGRVVHVWAGGDSPGVGGLAHDGLRRLVVTLGQELKVCPSPLPSRAFGTWHTHGLIETPDDFSYFWTSAFRDSHLPRPSHSCQFTM